MPKPLFHNAVIERIRSIKIETVCGLYDHANEYTIICCDFIQKLTADRVIQRSFWRAHRRDENGDIDMTLIPADIKAWYVNSSDEEETVSEYESDVETS